MSVSSRAICSAFVIAAITSSNAYAAELGRVDKRDSQTRVVLIQDCFLRSSHGSRGFVGCGVGSDWAAAAALTRSLLNGARPPVGTAASLVKNPMFPSQCIQ